MFVCKIGGCNFTYVCMQNQRLQLQFLSSWLWAVCRSKHVEQLRNIKTNKRM